jgi:heptosyltransferase-2
MMTTRVALAVGRLWYALAGRRPGRNIALKNLTAILIVRLDEIGDVVLTTPFLRELRRNAPYAWITLVVQPQTANVVENCPYVNEILTLDLSFRGLTAGTRRRHIRAFRLAVGRLWRRRFALAVIPRWGVDYHDGTFLAYLSGARRRVAYSEGVSGRKRQFNAGFDRMLTDVISDENAKHEVEHNLDVVRFLGGDVTDARLELWLDQQDRSFAARLFAEQAITPGDPLVAFAPGARFGRKQWPIERFAELGRLLLAEYQPYLVVVGGPDDRPLGERLEAELGARVINVAGRTTLRQTAAVLERCCLTVSNDSGPMHLAAAAGSAVVEIAWHACGGSSRDPDSPARFHPWGVPHVVVQPEHATDPCLDSCESREPHCILGVKTSKVWAAVRGLLAAGARIGTVAGDN